MPIVRPTCWELVTRPVAKPCSSSGRPDVAITPYETITHRWPMQAIVTPARASQTPESAPRPSRAAVNAAWRRRPVTRVLRAPRRAMTLGAVMPERAAKTP
ncbi:hypothetical protein GCM10010219_05720 [Streptomyces netropsis]|nr:hypothetical protein GCM10010219_05720 [Streptomyces netropsis]